MLCYVMLCYVMLCYVMLRTYTVYNNNLDAVCSRSVEMFSFYSYYCMLSILYKYIYTIYSIKYLSCF